VASQLRSCEPGIQTYLKVSRTAEGCLKLENTLDGIAEDGTETTQWGYETDLSSIHFGLPPQTAGIGPSLFSAIIKPNTTDKYNSKVVEFRQPQGTCRPNSVS